MNNPYKNAPHVGSAAFLDVEDIAGAIGINNNYSATTAPGVGDDSADGYSVGSMWVNTASSPKEAYQCMDATVGAAVWINTTLDISELGSGAIRSIEAATAPNDFLLGGSSPFNWIKKTLAQVLVILTSPLMMAGVLSLKQGADFTGAAVDLVAATGNSLDITTDTTTLTTFGTVAVGARFYLRFLSVRTITYHATQMILPGLRDIVTESGDRAVFQSLGSGNWLCHSYMKGNGKVLGDVIISTRPDAATTITADLMRGQTHLCGYARTYPLPNAIVGMSGFFRSTAAVVFSLDPDSSGTADAMKVGAVEYAAGEMISSDGMLGASIYIECTVADHWDCYPATIFMNGG